MQKSTNIRALLSEGDRRTVGNVPDVVASILARPAGITALIECVFAEDAAVRMRAADALEKISRSRRDLLQPYASALLAVLEETDQQELQWHFSVLLPRLTLNVGQRARTVAALLRCLKARSSIARTSALQGLADLCMQEPRLKSRVLDVLRVAEHTGTAAMKARSRKLIQLLSKR